MGLYELLARAIASTSKRSGLDVVKTHSIYTTPLSADSVVVDLGANVGDFTREMNRRFGCQCYAVEANPSMVAQIEANEHIHTYNLAVSDNNSPVKLVLSSNRETSSIYEEVASLYEATGTIECPGVTFEQFLKDNRIDAVDVLKVDIEGAERQLFQVTSDATLEAVGQITIEFHDFIPGTIRADEVRAIRGRLKRLGFYCIPFSYMMPKQDTCDFLFINLRRCPVPPGIRLNFSYINFLLNVQKIKAMLKSRVQRRSPGQGRE
jgi:FkbM family methyltransferase